MKKGYAEKAFNVGDKGAALEKGEGKQRKIREGKKGRKKWKRKRRKQR